MTLHSLSIKPKALIGLGNPGDQFKHTRHNIGFDIIDALAAAHGGQWQRKGAVESSAITLDSFHILLFKPCSYMNSSGDVVPVLKKQGFKADELLVIHDELELPFGKIAFKLGGSAKGHNGLKSIIERLGSDGFARLRFGIGRPAQREQVPQYVLQKFEHPLEVRSLINESLGLLEKLYL